MSLNWTTGMLIYLGSKRREPILFEPPCHDLPRTIHTKDVKTLGGVNGFGRFVLENIKHQELTPDFKELQEYRFNEILS